MRRQAIVENGAVVNVVISADDLGIPCDDVAIGIGATWDGSAFTPARQPEPPAPDPARDLSPVEFRYMLALSGLEDVWVGIETALREADTADARALYAQVRSQWAAPVYRLDRALALVAAIPGPVMAQVLAAVGMDASAVSADAIRAAWAAAATR